MLKGVHPIWRLTNKQTEEKKNTDNFVDENTI